MRFGPLGTSWASAPNSPDIAGEVRGRDFVGWKTVEEAERRRWRWAAMEGGGEEMRVRKRRKEKKRERKRMEDFGGRK
ncbi:unnamed protein product [Citrullus colocynthis]|uniref:Uncharacterized protein n=1 Tax=Citrullus colocynthis TaxID=252529 RepID=A0ABP0XNP3_9ROSI